MIKLDEQPENLGWRADGRLERYCSHGVGHTVQVKNVIYLKASERDTEVWWTHGCDGCCWEFEKDK